ncbi:MAG: hypothetical protein II919_01250 [Lachnospiraceae bacterium]|nr:hypothetical protein [Lachnospiraceae bacterium]MBQ3664716.1 hypothetical protein [Lachnospiraceae bacterium]
MADKGKDKGVNIKVAGHTIDHVATKVGQAVDKVTDGKIKVDAEKIGKKIDKKNIELDLSKLKK